MKKTITFLLSLVALLLSGSLSAQTIYAYTDPVSGIVFHFTVQGTNATLVGNSSSIFPASYPGILRLPSTVSDGTNTYTVTKLGSGVFMFGNYLRGADIVIPGTYTEIGDYPLVGSEINSVTFEPNSNLTSMGQRFVQESRYIKYIDMTKVITPPGGIRWYRHAGGTITIPLGHTHAYSTFYRIPVNTLIYLPNGTDPNLVPATLLTGGGSIEQMNIILDGSCKNFIVYDENTTLGMTPGMQHDLVIPHAFTAVKASYSRVFSNTSGKAVSTLYLPYPTDLPTGMQAYEFTLKGVDENGDKAFCFSPVPLGTRLQANHPYLVRVTDGATHTLPTMHNVQVPATPAISTTAQTSADGNWAFNGTTETLDNAAASALKAYYLNGNKWWAVQNGVENDYIAAYRCFVSSPTGAAPAKSFLMVIEEDNLTPTDIRQLERDTQADLKNGNHTFYSIDGKRIGTDYNALERGQMYIVNGKKFYKF